MGFMFFHVFSSKHAFTISRGTCMHACQSLQRGFGLIYKTCTVHAMTCAKIGFQPRRCISSFLENTNQRQCDYELHARGSDTNSAHLLSLHVTLNMYKESQSNTFFCFQFETPVDGISHGREMLMQACICFSSYAYVHTYMNHFAATDCLLLFCTFSLQARTRAENCRSAKLDFLSPPVACLHSWNSRVEHFPQF